MGTSDIDLTITDPAKIFSLKEDLCSELQPYFFKGKETGRDFDIISHPFVIAVPYHPSSNAYLNRQFHLKKLRIDELRKQCKYREMVFFYERPYRINAFLEICDDLNDTEYWQLASDIWTDSENIYQVKKLWTKIFTDKYRLPSRDAFMEHDDLETLNGLFDKTDKITVMRGCKHHNKPGFSWTTDRKTAEMFANRLYRYGQKKFIITGTVTRDKVIAYTNARSEKEIIVNPQYVRDRKIERL